MKKLNKLILTFFLTVLTSYCQDKFPFDVTVLNCDLKGLMTIDQKIILYGNFGNILISEDSGKKWLQNSIGDSIDIANMIVIKEYIVGHSSNYLFESHDRGMNWEISEKFNDTILSIQKYNDNLIILTSNKLIKYDNTLNKVDETIYIFDVSNPPINLICNQEYLYVLLKDLNLIKINIKDNSSSLIEFNIYSQIKKNDKVNNLSFINNSLCFVFKDTLMCLDLQTKTMNKFDNKIKSIFQYNDTLFCLSSNSTLDKPADILFYKLENKNLRLISKTRSDRLIDSLNISNFLFVNSNEIYSVGSNKLILKSKNRGIKWDLISCYDNIGYNSSSLHSDTLYAALKGLINIKTTDKGITWLPQKYLNDTIYKFNKLYPQASFFDNYGNGMVFNWVSEVKNGSIKFPNLQITNDYGDSFKYLFKDSLDFYPANSPCFLRYRDAIVLLYNTYIGFPSHKVNMIHLFDNKFNLENNIILDTLIFKFCFNFENELYALQENLTSARTYDGKDSTLYSYSLFKASKTSLKDWELITNLNTIKQISRFKIESNLIVFVLYYGQPTVLTYDSLGRIDTSLTIKGYSHDSLAVYDLKNNYYKVVFGVNNNEIWADYIKFDNLYYFQGNNQYYLTNDITNKNSWYTTKSNKYSLFGQSYSNDNRSIEKRYRSVLIKPNSYFKTEVIETQTEDQTYFYSYPPYPLPARNELKSLIYWDMSYNIDDSDIGVYDIYGNKVADKDKISINKLNSYSGYLTWDCSSVGTGVYMIQIKHGTNTHNIRAMVVR